MLADLADVSLLTGAVLLFALPALFRKEARGWLLLLLAVVAGGILLTSLGAGWQRYIPFLAHAEWNWLGKALSFSLGLTVAIGLIATGKFKARELGLSVLQAPGTLRGVALVILPYLALLVVLSLTLVGQSEPPSREAVYFQATMPGLDEELAYRGVILALFDRMFTGRFRLLGAEMGYGAIAVSLMFGLGHIGLFNDKFALHLYFINFVSTAIIGFILAWLRQRSRSLVLPVVVHGLTGLLAVSVPKLL